MTLRIVDLNNVPLVSGTCFVKWHLSHSAAAEHRGRTQKCTIKDHKVDFDYQEIIDIRLVIGKDQMLQEAFINFEVLQEYSSGGKGERLVLGNIRLNLAEYVDASEQNQGKDDEGVTRRYLMQDSKINSTLKVGINLRHVEGDRNYYAYVHMPPINPNPNHTDTVPHSPTLKTAPIFGGIAGVMAQEAPEGLDEVGHMPSLSSKSRDAGEMQDMYRQNLAASWVAQPGELKANDCVEDIFLGGDGWGSQLNKKKATSKPNGTVVEDDDQTPVDPAHLAPSSDDHSRSKSLRRSRGHHRNHSQNKSIDSKKGRGFGDWNAPAHEGKHGEFGQSSIHHRARKMERQNSRQGHKKKKNEVDEFDNAYREDLRGWTVKVKALA